LLASNLQFLINGVTLGAVYALVGVGFVLIYQVTGVINFAQGEFVMLGALGSALLHEAGLPLLPAALVAVVGTAAVGAGVQRLALRPARGASVERLIIITIGVSITIKGVVLLAVGTEPHFVEPFSRGGPIRLGGAVILPQYLWVLAVTMLAVAALAWFFTRTLQGKAMRACAMNPDAARLVAVAPARMALLAFALAATLGGLSGVVLAPIQNPDYGIGLGLGLRGFTAAVVGGLDSVTGAVVGGLLLGLVEAFAAGHIPSGYKDAVAFGILLVVLLVRPGGVLRRVAVGRV
jgi:branched-chain amino acid transport system permease protein